MKLASSKPRGPLRGRGSMRAYRRAALWAFLGLVLTAGRFAAAAEAPAVATNPAQFRFVACADPHLLQNLPNQLTGEEKFRAMLDAIRRLPERPDLLLILGDIAPTTNSLKLLVEAKQVLPTHVVWGNNDLAEARALMRPLFAEDLRDRDFYSFRHKGYLFIGLCDAIPFDHIGHLSSDLIKGEGQVAWLRDRLAEAARTSMPAILFAHIPVPAQPADANMWLAINDQVYLRDLILKCQPMALLFGHMHGRNAFDIGSSRVMILPSICWNFGEQPIGFYIMAVSKNGLQPTFIPLPAKPNDQVEQRKEP